ncbi:sporulation protein YjcZ [Chungangia koreensis]|uniref:Sporulation protein YjcZ n=1 Tax=Chungangia koreensis TaxID=752657 RepID=A0ABV8X2W7_9LACT
MYGCNCGCGGYPGGFGGYGYNYGCYPGRSSFILIVVLFILLIIVGKSYTC